MKAISVLAFITALLLSSISCAKQPKLKVLIIDGQNNHQIWPKSTVMMKQYLEDTNLFEVEVYRSAFTWKGEKYLEEYSDACSHCEALPEAKPDPNFRPEFTNYDLVVSNFGWKAAPWPEDTQLAFEEYMHNGGGLVVVHAANNSWGEWGEFNKMIGLGGWGGRNEKSGPYVFYTNDGKLTRDTSKGGGGGHGPQHEFAIQARQPNHPIMKGLPEIWMHTKDELYHKLRGPAENMTILATAYSSPNYKGTDRHEPALMTLDYGKGRVFHTILGHTDYSFESVGFITTFNRGAEWAATGKVTQNEIPTDFPTAEKSSARPFTRR